MSFWDYVIGISALVSLLWLTIKNDPWDMSFRRNPEDKCECKECKDKDNCPFKEFLD